MTKYKPVKIMFDLDDEYHLMLYNHLKKQTNGSSYIRTLLHQDINNNNLVVKEQDKSIVEKPKVVDIKSVNTASALAASQQIKINNYSNDNDDNEVFISDLI